MSIEDKLKDKILAAETKREAKNALRRQQYKENKERELRSYSHIANSYSDYANNDITSPKKIIKEAVRIISTIAIVGGLGLGAYKFFTHDPTMLKSTPPIEVPLPVQRVPQKDKDTITSDAEKNIEEQTPLYYMTWDVLSDGAVGRYVKLENGLELWIDKTNWDKDPSLKEIPGFGVGTLDTLQDGTLFWKEKPKTEITENLPTENIPIEEIPEKIKEEKTTKNIVENNPNLDDILIPEPKPKSQITEKIDIPSKLELEIADVSTEITLDAGVYLVDFDIVISPKGTLILKPGVNLSLKEDADIIVNGSLIARGKNDNDITIYGVGNAGHIVIDNFSSTYRGPRRKVDMKNVELYGLNGTSGGAIEIISGSYRIEDCNFHNNNANIGGAVLIRDSFEFENSYNSLFRNNTLRNNTADKGGGLAIIGGGRVIIKGNRLIGNLADEVGGGVYLTQTGIEFQDNEINNNLAPRGGGIAAVHANPTIKNCKITENTAIETGGAYYSDFAGGALLNNTFEGNVSTSEEEFSFRSSNRPNMRGNKIK